MSVQLEDKRKEVENLIDALKTVTSMSVSDVVEIIMVLIKENDELKHTLNRTLEDKVENETNYENTLRDYVKTMDILRERIKKLEAKNKPKNKGAKNNA